MNNYITHILVCYVYISNFYLKKKTLVRFVFLRKILKKKKILNPTIPYSSSGYQFPL